MGDVDGGDEYREELFRDLTHNVMELCVHVGLFNSVADSWPEHVRENWVSKIQAQIEWVNKEIEEVQQFAEHFDG